MSISDEASSLRHVRTLGKSFVTGHGALRRRFMVRGVALSTAGVKALGDKDILANEHHAMFAASIVPVLKSLNVNVVRVYQVDPEHRHDQSMKLLDAHNIYVMVGLATHKYSVNRKTGEYGYGTFLRAAKLVDEFQAYDNTFCFSVGNEVEFPGQMAADLHHDNQHWTAAQVVSATVTLELKVAQAMKSFARDIKAYMAAKSYRAIPVGCAMQDGPQSSWSSSNTNAYQQGLIGTDVIAQYYAAGPEAERMDYIGINCYRYKTVSPPMKGYYDGLVHGNEAVTLPVPVFLSESGAFGQLPRDWADVTHIYEDKRLTAQLSGQVAFQLLDEGQHFGLYDVTAPGGTITLTPCTTPGDGLTALQGAFATAASMARNVGPVATTPVSPTTAPTTVQVPGLTPLQITWPALLAPATLPDVTVTFVNNEPDPVDVVQRYHTFCKVAAGATSPPIKVCRALTTDMLCPSQNWDKVCSVAGGGLNNGSVVTTPGGPWGGSCSVS